ncbi:MAG: CRISPR-associated ring nuclease Csm6 [Venatoribacter sp.]
MSNKNVLFLVTGMTPQIITETIWALACDPSLDEGSQWVPDEVHVLSTEHGLNQIRSRLLQGNVIEQLKKDYSQLKGLVFKEELLHVIKDENGQALADLKTPQDNERAADQINEYIRELTKQENTSLHVSIAGGRKTMGFYAGYALSLHGRAQDKMSHVLVDERYESIPEFFYPTPGAVFVKDRNNQSWPASKARIWLAEIPFVRMKYAIKDRHQIKKDSFIDTVNKINEAANDIHIEINVAEALLVINKKMEVRDLSPREFSFFCVFAQNRQASGIGFFIPNRNMSEKDLSSEEVALISALSVPFRAFYSQLRYEEYIDDRNVDIGKNAFEQAKTNLKKTLENSLGLELAAKLELVGGRGKAFYLDVPASAIEFV